MFDIGPTAKRRIVSGATRHVILTRRWAVKIPRLTHWRLFLEGLLANMQERMFWRQLRDRRLCPVRWSLPGGWLVVMHRADEMSEEAYATFDPVAFCAPDPQCEFAFEVPAETKRENYGIYRGRIVAVDYGS